MPNWCYTSYAIEGKRKEVQSLYSRMNRLEKRKKPLVKNGFGKTWLGCLVTELGADWENVYCRGSWDNLQYDGEVLTFYTETAWRPMTEVFELIKDLYPSLKIYYAAEEDGCCLYCTNDQEGKHFPDRYKIEAKCETEYFATLSGLSDYVSGIVGKEIKTMDELNTAIEEWNEATDDYDNMIYLNEYTIETEDLCLSSN